MDAGSYVSDIFFNGSPNGPGDLCFQWSAQRARGGFVFQWSAQRFCGVGVGFFSMRPTGLRGRGRVFFNGPPNGPGGVRFSMVRPTRLEGFRFSMVCSTGGGGFVFQWFAQRARQNLFFNGSPNPVLTLVRPTRSGLILVRPTCARY